MFTKLIKNEFTKIYKKKETVIMVGLILLLSVVLPIGIQFTTQSSHNDISLMDSASAIEIAEYSLSREATTIPEQIDYMRYENDLRYWTLVAEEQMNVRDWRINLMERYRSLLNTTSFLEATQQGFTIDAILSNGSDFDYSLLESLLKASPEEIQQIIDNNKATIAHYEQVISDNDYIEGSKIYIQIIDENIRIANEEMALLDGNDPEDANKIDALVARIDSQEENRKTLQYRIDNNIPYDNSWKSNALIELDQVALFLMERPSSEADFYLHGSDLYEDYQEYVGAVNAKLESRQATYDTLWNSIEVDQPLMGKDVYEGRQTIYDTMEIMMVVITVFVIIIGSGIISSEFSKGTIRMLVARPVSRGSIYLSKASTLIIIGFALVIVSAIISTLTAGVIYGFDGFSLPVVSSVAGVLTSQSFFSYLFKEMIVVTGGIIFMTGLVMMLTTLTKNTVITLTVSLLLYLVAAPASALLAPFGFVQYTMLPYINAGMVRSVESFYNSFWGMLINLDLTLGFIGTCLSALVLIAIGYLSFTKKDIVN